MKSTICRLALAGLFSISINAVLAQSRPNQIGVIAEVGFPDDLYDMGGGIFVKGAFGIPNNAQVTLQAGVSKFGSNIRFTDLNGNIYNDKGSIRAIPVLLGYKQYVKQFFIEPQLGFGELGGKVDIGGDWSRPSNGAFFWAAGAGFQFPKLEVGLRYQSAHATGGTNAGIWGEKNFSFVGVHAGYFFSF